jgi:hypothetical protein
MDKPIEVFYVDHAWNQRNEFWQWECSKCGERCRVRRTARGGFIYAMREPGDTRGQLCVVIEREWRD